MSYETEANKRERGEATESIIKRRNTLSERLVANTEPHRGLVSFSHAVYRKVREFKSDINIVTVFEYVEEWCNDEQCRRFYLHAPRNMDSTVIVYSNCFDTELLEQVATNCIGNISLYSPKIPDVGGLVGEGPHVDE